MFRSSKLISTSRKMWMNMTNPKVLMSRKKIHLHLWGAFEPKLRLALPQDSLYVPSPLIVSSPWNSPPLIILPGNVLTSQRKKRKLIKNKILKYILCIKNCILNYKQPIHTKCHNIVLWVNSKLLFIFHSEKMFYS